MPVVLRFDLDGHGDDACDDPGPLWVAWCVSYQRVAAPEPQGRDRALLAGEVVIAEGAVPAWDG